MKSVFLLLFFCFTTVTLKAQYYDDVLTYYINDSTFNGVKIKTNLPYVSNSQMPTIMIEGNLEGYSTPINLTLVYFINSTGFIQTGVTTSGGYNPKVTLAGENGKVIILLESKAYFQRLHVRAFGTGRSGETPANYSGWIAVDSALIPTAAGITVVSYKNAFAGNVSMPGSGIWNSTGNVGVGTVLPAARLSVYGPNNNDGTITFQSNVDSRFYITEGDNTLRIGGLNSSSGVINVTNTGNVGIGTTSPGAYKLAVEGSIGARRVDVKQTSWADFVFQSDYQLPSLQEVENYISVNKHLAGIPSADEVEKNGIDLGEMNKKLLQKVEELTLYLISLEKNMINQEKRIQQLEAAKK